MADKWRKLTGGGGFKFGGTENGADCSKCGGTVAVLFKTRNGTSLIWTRTALQIIIEVICRKTQINSASGSEAEQLRLR